jgi:uncharacterized membrane protein
MDAVSAVSEDFARSGNMKAAKGVSRLDSLDLLRGLVMVFMALDHVRYPYFTGLTFFPEDMRSTYAALFLTRWVTHFCAPMFFFLAGAGAYLSLAQGRSLKEVSGFLWKRGLWLVFLELTVIAFAWSFLPSWRFGGVIWSLGWAMVLMSVVVRLPLKSIAALGVSVIALHNLLDTVSPQSLGSFSGLWKVFYSGGAVKIGSINFPILYSIIPWAAVMAAGYATGQVLMWEPERRRRWLVIAGASMMGAFILLRATNLYGNPAPFAVQERWEKSFILFLNVAKYPASLQFLLMTIGPSLLFLGLMDRFDFRSASGWVARKIITLGRVPMFYYVLHLFLIHLLAILVGVIYGQPVSWMWSSPLPMGRPTVEGYGHGLPFVYAMTIAVVVLLYFPCRWFAEVKRRRDDWWLRYL